MVADDFNAWVLSLKNILQRKGKLVSVTCSGQAEGITKRGVFELFPLKGRVKWCWQPRCWDTAPSIFFVVWQHPEGHPQPPHEGCCTKTNWAAGRASKRLKLKQKGEDWEKEESMRNRTHFSAMVSAVLTSSWFWGAFMWKMERAKR